MSKLSYSRLQETVLNAAARTLGNVPGRFGIVRALGFSYSLRCIVFHNISASESPFISGMNVNTSIREFEEALKFLTTHYVPVTLEAVLSDADGRSLPPRAVLVTFDDAYASVVDVAAPLCHKLDVPAVFFVNAAFLDNQRLAPDNLVCYVANMLGMETINAAVRAVRGGEIHRLRSASEVFASFFPSITLAEREIFLQALLHLAGISDRCLAEKTKLYLSTKQLGTLKSFNFEIGNHTYSHAHGRSLSSSDFAREINRNKTELEALSGTKVRSFSQPYGSAKDLTPELANHLRQSGHEAVFLSESVANPPGADRFQLDRVNPRARREDTLFVELEVLPRLRVIRNRLFRGSELHRRDQVIPPVTH